MWGVSIVGMANIFLKDILEEAVKMSYQFPNKQKKYIPVSESMCDIQGEMLLNFMSYDASHVEEQARNIMLSIAVFPGKVFRLYLYFFFSSIRIGTALENKRLYKKVILNFGRFVRSYRTTSVKENDNCMKEILLKIFHRGSNRKCQTTPKLLLARCLVSGTVHCKILQKEM